MYSTPQRHRIVHPDSDNAKGDSSVDMRTVNSPGAPQRHHSSRRSRSREQPPLRTPPTCAAARIAGTSPAVEYLLETLSLATAATGKGPVPRPSDAAAASRRLFAESEREGSHWRMSGQKRTSRERSHVPADPEDQRAVDTADHTDTPPYFFSAAFLSATNRERAKAKKSRVE